MENTIQIIKSGNQWIGCYLGPHAEEIKDLFGDWRLPAALDQADRVRDEHFGGQRSVEAQKYYDDCRNAVSAAKKLI